MLPFASPLTASVLVVAIVFVAGATVKVPIEYERGVVFKLGAAGVFGIRAGRGV